MQFDNYKKKIFGFIASDSRLTYEVALDTESDFFIRVISVKTGIPLILSLEESPFLRQYVAYYGYGLELKEKLTEENFNTLFNTLKMCTSEGRTLWVHDENKERMVGTMWTDGKNYTPQDVFNYFNEECKEVFIRDCKKAIKYISFSDFYGNNEILLKKDGDTFVVEQNNK